MGAEGAHLQISETMEMESVDMGDSPVFSSICFFNSYHKPRNENDKRRLYIVVLTCLEWYCVQNFPIFQWLYHHIIFIFFLKQNSKIPCIHLSCSNAFHILQLEETFFMLWILIKTVSMLFLSIGEWIHAPWSLTFCHLITTSSVPISKFGQAGGFCSLNPLHPGNLKVIAMGKEKR